MSQAPAAAAAAAADAVAASATAVDAAGAGVTTVAAVAASATAIAGAGAGATAVDAAGAGVVDCCCGSHKSSVPVMKISKRIKEKKKENAPSPPLCYCHHRCWYCWCCCVTTSTRSSLLSFLSRLFLISVHFPCVLYFMPTTFIPLPPRIASEYTFLPV